jgi:hypothetical protein
LRNPPQFPVIIGVTGHRRIAPEAVQPVRRAVKDLLTSWRCQFGPALHVLTALADGADQLVADVAHQCYVPIIAVAPFHYRNYRSTLRRQDEFDVHWNNAAFRLELPDVGSDTEINYLDRQYEQLGVLLIRRSHLLLGLWDGELRADRGGTAEVIRMRIEGDHGAETFQHSPIFLDAKSYLDETNRGPLLHIFTPRDCKAGTAEGTTTGCSRLLGLPEPPKQRHWSSLLPVIRWLTQSAEQRRTADEKSFVRGVRRLLGLPTLRKRRHLDGLVRGVLRLMQLPDGWIARRGARFVRGVARLFGAPGPTAAASNAAVVNWIGVPVEPKHVLKQIYAAGVEDFMLMDKLNRTIGRISGSDELLFRQQLSYLHVTGLPQPALSAAWFLKRLQASVDTAAQSFQASMLGHFVPARHPWQMLVALYRRQRTTKHTIRFGALAVFALEAPATVFLFESYVDAQCHSRSDGLYYILAYLLMLGGASLYYYLSVLPQAWQERFQDYRALAEALRVQLYWAIAAVPASVSDHYLRKQSGELGWIQFALRGPSLWAASVAGIARKPLRNIIERGWINDQESFFASKAELNRRAAEGAELFTTIFVALGVAGALALSALYFAQTQSSVPPSCPFEGHTWLIVLTATMPAVAVFFAVSARLRSYWPHAHAYALMRRMFRQAAGLMNASGASDDQFQSIVRELGREALSENAEWLGEHCNRKIEPGS